jgi:hypothetical protein
MTLRNFERFLTSFPPHRDPFYYYCDKILDDPKDSDVIYGRPLTIFTNKQYLKLTARVEDIILFLPKKEEKNINLNYVINFFLPTHFIFNLEIYKGLRYQK